jgi:hypothetical protein
LADEVRRKVRESGLLVWLDAERQYVELVDALAKGAHDFQYPVVSLRGSYLEVMLRPRATAMSCSPSMSVHLPALNQETIQETPLFEFHKAGTVFEKSLGTLVKEAARALTTRKTANASAKGRKVRAFPHRRTPRCAAPALDSTTS